MIKPRIHVAIGTFHPQVGGTERRALGHARNLRLRGYQVTIITLRHRRAWPQHEAIEGVPVVRVAGRVLDNREQLPGPLRKLAYLLGLSALGWTLWRRRRHYDVLCVYRLGPLDLPAALACLLTGKPMVIMLCATSRTRARASPPLLKADVPGIGTEAQKHHVGDVEALQALPALIRACILYLLHRIRVVLVAPSSRFMHELTEGGIQLPSLCIPTGVDVARFAPVLSDSLDEERARTVVCVARLDYLKGIDVLLHAWRLVQEQVPQAHLVVVGRGPLRDQLERLAETLGVKSSVEFAGLRDDVPAQLRRGSLGVLASRSEGMPNAVLEAMACGLACVATRVSGSEDIIQHGVNGLLVEPEDPHGLARALLTLLQDPATAQQYGRAARTTIEQRYSLDRSTDSYVALYEQLVNG